MERARINNQKSYSKRPKQTKQKYEKATFDFDWSFLEKRCYKKVLSLDEMIEQFELQSKENLKAVRESNNRHLNKGLRQWK